MTKHVRRIQSLPRAELERLCSMPHARAAAKLGVSRSYWGKFARAFLARAGLPPRPCGRPRVLDALSPEDIEEFAELADSQLAEKYGVCEHVAYETRRRLEREGQIPPRKELRAEARRRLIAEAKALREQGLTYREIGQELGYSEDWAWSLVNTRRKQ
jgi:hypothetical protein